MRIDLPPVNPPFLRPVGEAEGEPLRLLLWVSLSLCGAILAVGLVGALFQMLDPAAIKAVETFGAPRTRPGQLFLDVRTTAIMAAATAAAMGAVLLAARFAFRRPAWTFTVPARDFRIGEAALGVLVYGLLLAATLAAATLLAGETLNPPVLDLRFPLEERILYALGVTPLLLLAAASEEVVFRGALLQASSGFIRNRLALCLLNGAVFGLLHGNTDPVALIIYLLLAVVWSWSALALGGLEFAIGAHFVHNLTIALFIEPVSAADAQETYAWADLLPNVGIAVGTALFVWLLARRRGTLTTT